MKTLLQALTLVACSLSVQAQSITNLVAKWTVNGTTNATLTLDGVGSKKDAAAIAGLVFAYGSYTNAQGTNAVVAFDTFLKQNYSAFIKSYTEQKQASDNAARIAAINIILSTKADVLLPGDFTALDAIIAKGQ